MVWSWAPNLADEGNRHLAFLQRLGRSGTEYPCFASQEVGN